MSLQSFHAECVVNVQRSTEATCYQCMQSAARGKGQDESIDGYLLCVAEAMQPALVISRRRDHGICETCGLRLAATEWAGTGELICWACCGEKREEYR